jgi:transcriptional regulator with XRE-family HTH domain
LLANLANECATVTTHWKKTLAFPRVFVKLSATIVNMDRPTTPSDVVAARVRDVRTKRKLTVADLAERCAAIGAPQLTVQAIYKIEGQRESTTRPPRQVTVDELLALAAALNVAPVHLLVSPDDYLKTYRLTSGTSETAVYVRHWIRGSLPLPDGDPREYFSEVPRTEYEWAQTAFTGWQLPTDWKDEL